MISEMPVKAESSNKPEGPDAKSIPGRSRRDFGQLRWPIPRTRKTKADDDSVGQLAKLAAADGTDSSFEQAFANIAHSVVKDKAPGLFDHELGFQMLERSEDGKKATGVIAFKIGKQYAYVPLFFVNGRLKGTEILYLANQDLPVPLDEGWVNKIKNQGDHVIGKGTGESAARAGVRQPDYTRLTGPYKFAQWVLPCMLPFLPTWADISLEENFLADAEGVKQAMQRQSLPEFVKRASLPQLAALSQLVSNYPVIAKAYDDWYGLDALTDRIKEARAQAAAPNLLEAVVKNRGSRDVFDLIDTDAAIKRAAVTGQVRVVYFSRSVSEPLFTDADREELVRTGVKIKDDRDDKDTSMAYRVEEALTLFNPSTPGLYDVLTTSGLAKCLVWLTADKEIANRAMALVVNLDESDHPYSYVPAKEVWCKKQYEKSEWNDWLETLPAVSFDASGSYDPTDPMPVSASPGRKVIIDGRGAILPPMREFREAGPKSWTVTLDLPFGCGCESFGRENETYDGNAVRMAPLTYPEQSTLTAHLTKPGTAIRWRSPNVFIPEDARALPVRNKYCSDWIVRSAESAERMLRKDAAMLTVLKSGRNYLVNDADLGGYNQALGCLVAQHGLREKAARELLDSLPANLAARFMVKYADAYSPFLTGGGPYAPPMPDQPPSASGLFGFPGDVQLPVTDAAVVDGMQGGPGLDVNQYFEAGDPDVVAVQQAAARGDKELFDTKTIGSIVRATRPEDSDEDLPDMIKGMRALGKQIMRFYAHGDKFIDRYGKQDMPELSAALTTAFKDLGDVILFLQEKTVDPFPDVSLSDPSLDDAGGNEN